MEWFLLEDRMPEIRARSSHVRGTHTAEFEWNSTFVVILVGTYILGAVLLLLGLQ